jgi:putative endopeptidase
MTTWIWPRPLPQALVLSTCLAALSSGLLACEDESAVPATCTAGTPGCPVTPVDTDMKVPPPVVTKAAFERDFVDGTANPCDDFYRFACGNWTATHPLTDGSLARVRFEEIEAQVETTVSNLLETAITNRTSRDPDDVAMRSYFDTCTQAPQQRGVRDKLRALLAPIDHITTLDDLARQSAELRKLGAETLFLQYTSIDLFEPTRFVITVDQGARAVKYPSLYLDPDNQPVLAVYQRTIAALAASLGVAIDPAAVVRVETALSAAESPRDAAHDDPRTSEHKLTFAELTALAPHFPWSTTFAAYGLPGLTEVNVRSTSFVQKLDALLVSLPLSDWKDYLRWQLLSDKAPLGDQELRDQHFAFYGRLIEQEDKAPSTSQTCARATLQRFIGVMARRFADVHLGPAARGQAMEITMALRDTFARRIKGLPWLDPATRDAAETKLANIVAMIGVPEAFPHHGPTTGTLLDADLLDRREDAQGIVRSLGQPIERSKLWIATGLEVNAFYAPQVNSITLPAAFLLAPAFDPARHPLGNFAALGSVIGHEFTHGFDSTGRFFDERGALRSWWSEATNAEFESRGMCVQKFYSGLQPLPGKPIDGRVTLGENIADLGGVRMAYETAMRLHGDAAAYEGFDAKQQFFLGYGQLWCANLSDRFIDLQLQQDEHAPNPARVFGSLAHLPEFADAFHCPATAAMRAQPVCSIW